MEMHRSLRGDKHEFCLTVIKFKHVRSCPSFDIVWKSLFLFGIFDCLLLNTEDHYVCILFFLLQNLHFVL